MACPDGEHDLIAVNPFVHPTAKDAKGNPLEVIGAPPQSKEEPAWCRKCGAIWKKRATLFGVIGGGWGFSHHDQDTEAPTIANMARNTERSRRMRAYLIKAAAVISSRSFTPLSMKAEAELAELQDELWKDMSDLERSIIEQQIELLKKEWPSDA